MKKEIIKTITILILIILFSSNINASIFATIGLKGLSFINPQVAQVVQTAISLSDPTAFVQGYIIQQISGEIMGEIAKQSPEAAKAIQQYNQIKGWVDEGSKISQDLKLNEKSELSSGSIKINEKERDVSSIINSKSKEGSIKVTSMEISSTGENEDVMFTAKEKARLEINGKKYENLKEGSTIKIERDGIIKEADITSTKQGTYEFGGRQIQVEQDTRIVYKDGITEVYGKEKTIQISNQLEKHTIKINGENIKIDQQKITGSDFTLDEKRFQGLQEGNIAEVIPTEKGYILGKNTIGEDDKLIVTSEKGNVFFSKTCQSTLGFENYVGPCGTKLTMQGQVSVQLKEGNNFGLDIKKDDILRYDLDGGKVILDKSEQTIYTKIDKSVMITNGDTITTYTTINGVQQVLVDPNSLSGETDVKITTKVSEFIATEDTETTMYVCPMSQTSRSTITGAVSILEKCKIALGLNTENVIVGKSMWTDYPTEIIIEEGKYEKFYRNGKVYYNKLITTNKEVYSISSDGSVEIWKKQPKLGFYPADFTVSDEQLDYLGIPKTQIDPTKGLSEPEGQSNYIEKKLQQSSKPIEDKINAFEKIGEKKYINDREYMESIKEGDVYGIAIQSGGEVGWVTSLPNGKGVRSDAVEVIKDSKGKIIRFESVSNQQTYIPIGNGKYKLITPK
ncbi:MAG: hypothetical protein NT139_01370 [Candidatus Woesearchaeota archaeon]|nr:hypothetical protein [Candidatus Woesearchaeota archaeon]